MKIRTIAPQIPDNATTARISEIAPVLDTAQNLVLVQEGENNRRSWGCVKVTSTVVVRTRTFLAVHVGVVHKYRGGQQWYFYQQPAGAGGNLTRITAAKLTPRRRRQVLEAIEKGKAPGWAKQPFTDPKPRTSLEKHTRYKAVCIGEDGSLRSLYDDSEYVIGKTRQEAAIADHCGGFYVYVSADAARNAEIPSRSANSDATRVVLKVEVWGRCVKYGSDYLHDPSLGHDSPNPNPKQKQAWTYIKPLEVVS